MTHSKVTLSNEFYSRKGSGGHWRSGQVGSITTYANEVMKKPSAPDKPKGRGQKIRKVKVLGDEPVG